MALLVYQNQLRMDLIIPGWESTFHLYPGEYVGGEYYTRFAPTLLTDVTDQNIPIESIKYIYPGSTAGPSEGGAIDAINGIAPIQTSTLAGVTTISLDTLTGSLFGPGEIVKSINNATDAITIVGDSGIGVNTNLDTITIYNTQPGFTSIYSSPPLYLDFGESDDILLGSINITPENNGGAVALQATTTLPTPQLGIVSISGIDLGWSTSVETQPYFDRLLTGHYTEGETGGEISSVLWGTGNFNTSGFLTSTSGLKADTLTIYQTLTFDPSTGLITEIEEQTTTPLINFNESTSFIELETEIRNKLFLTDSQVYPDTYGRIEGIQGSSYTQPFISLSTIEGQTTPLIKLKAGYPFGATIPNVYLDVVDNTDVSIIKLHGDGIITARTLEVDTIEATAVNAETISTNSTLITGPTTEYITTSGPSTVMADCSGGEVVIILPDLNGFTKSLTVTIIKIDNSNNDVFIINGHNSTINGSTLAVSLTKQYEPMTIVSNGINWFKIGAMGGTVNVFNNS